MKVVLLNTADHGGGAAIAALRLTEALQTVEVEAHLLVRTKHSSAPYVHSLSDGGLARWRYKTAFLAERALLYCLNGFDRAHLFHASLANTGCSLVHHPLVREADVLHIHWINQGFLSLRQLEELARLGKPIVWTMHDMWSFSAVLHHTGELTDGKGIERCAERGVSLPYGLLEKQMKRKARLFQSGRFVMVGCSEWIAEACRRSPLARYFSVKSIPNPIDTEHFAPGDKTEARARWGFSSEERIILFGAVNAADERKGTHELIEALHFFARKYASMHAPIRVVIFGKKSDFFEQRIPFSITEVGFVRDEERMIDLYRAADLYVTPSLEENLPNTIMEAMSVGLPVVGFAIGGIPEMIEHERTGYVADYRSAESLAKGIDFVLRANPNDLSAAARAKSVACYAQREVARRYRSLYQSLLDE